MGIDLWINLILVISKYAIKVNRQGKRDKSTILLGGLHDTVIRYFNGDTKSKITATSASSSCSRRVDPTLLRKLS